MDFATTMDALSWEKALLEKKPNKKEKRIE
jgi:hypothetical protein